MGLVNVGRSDLMVCHICSIVFYIRYEEWKGSRVISLDCHSDVFNSLAIAIQRNNIGYLVCNVTIQQ